MSTVKTKMPERAEVVEDVDIVDAISVTDAAEESEKSGAVAVRDPSTVGKVTGAISNKDLPMPILSMVYGVGELAAEFAPGDLVLDKEHLLVSKTKPLNVILISADVYWKEYFGPGMYQSGMRPRTYRTEAEVAANGGTTTYGPANEPPTFKRAMTLEMLIEKPEGVDCYLFFADLFGKKYSPARWYVDKTAFQRKGNVGVGVEVMKQAGFALRGRGLQAGKWQITTGFVDMGANKVAVPSIKLIGQYTDAEVAQINALLGL